jgi:hypothetical protein
VDKPPYFGIDFDTTNSGMAWLNLDSEQEGFECC